MANERKNLATELVKGRAATVKDPLELCPLGDQGGKNTVIFVVASGQNVGRTSGDLTAGGGGRKSQ